MKELTISIEGESLDDLTIRLSEISEAILDGYTSGEGWSLTESEEK